MEDQGQLGLGEEGGKFVPLSGMGMGKGVTRQITRPSADHGINLAAQLGEEERKKLGRKIVEDFESDVRSRSGRVKKFKDFNELYTCLMEGRSWSRGQRSNVCLPIITYPVLQVQARLYDMIWPENGKIMNCAPSSPADAERAQATETYANHYIRTNIPEMETGFDDTVAQLVIFGSTFRRTHWNEYESRISSDWLPMEDVVVPATVRCSDPSMRGVPRYSVVQRLSLYDLEEYEANGTFIDVKGIGEESEDEQKGELRQSTDKIDGVSDNSSDERRADAPRIIIEHYFRTKLPKGTEPGMDGKAHYVIGWVDKASGRLLRLITREEDDPQDVKRAAREQQKADEQFLPLQAAFDAEMQGYATVAEAARLSGKEPPPFDTQPPVAPVVAPPRRREVTFLTHYRCFPSEGFYGLGFGDFLAPLNRATNALLNQRIDAGSLRNAMPGLISRQLRMQRGTVEFEPGKLVEVDGPVSAMKDGILFLDPPMPDPSTQSIISLLIQMAEKVSGSSDIMSGSTSGANRTAKEISILNAQLMKSISVVARRVKASFRHELDKIWRLLGTYLPDEPTPMDATDELGAPVMLTVSREMFLPDSRISPAADPRMKFEQREDAQAVYGFAINNPLIAQNPNALFVATRSVLRTYDNPELMAAVQPPPPPEPPQPKVPVDEEAGWLNGEDEPPHPDDDDDTHIQSHLMFLQSPDAQVMDKSGRQLSERHLRAHVAQRHKKRAGAMGPPQGMGGPPDAGLAGAMGQPPPEMIGMGTGGPGGPA